MTGEPTERPPMRSKGTLVTDEMLARLAEKAEAGFDLDRLRPRPRAGPASDRRQRSRCRFGSLPRCVISSTSAGGDQRCRAAAWAATRICPLLANSDCPQTAGSSLRVTTVAKPFATRPVVRL